MKMPFSAGRNNTTVEISPRGSMVAMATEYFLKEESTAEITKVPTYLAAKKPASAMEAIIATEAEKNCGVKSRPR